MGTRGRGSKETPRSAAVGRCWALAHPGWCCRRRPTGGARRDRPKNDAAGHRRSGADEAPAPTDLAGAGYNAQGLPEAMALGGAEGETTLTYRYTASGQRTYKKPEGSEATRYVRDGSAVYR